MDFFMTLLWCLVMAPGPHPLSLYSMKQLEHSSEVLLLCSMEERKSCGFVTTRGWVIDGKILIFWMNYCSFKKIQFLTSLRYITVTVAKTFPVPKLVSFWALRKTHGKHFMPPLSYFSIKRNLVSDKTCLVFCCCFLRRLNGSKKKRILPCVSYLLLINCNCTY